MALRQHSYSLARKILSERFFSEKQIDALIPKLSQQLVQEPDHLAEVIDTWNDLFSRRRMQGAFDENEDRTTKSGYNLSPRPDAPVFGENKLTIAGIISEIEPDLLLLEPNKLRRRHHDIMNLGIVETTAHSWALLNSAPRGFYLQDWMELYRKIMYIEHRIVDIIMDKKESRRVNVHPLVKNAKAVELDFNEIRARHLFAERTGYKTLGHMYPVQTAEERPTLTEFLLSSDKEFLRHFAPFCKREDFNAFKRYVSSRPDDDDEDDADIFKRLAELNSMSA